jgi:UTP--glucose-1-phosphate uridylyltransferase
VLPRPVAAPRKSLHNHATVSVDIEIHERRSLGPGRAGELVGSMKRKVTKAVFPVAGLGTRFLPATKSIPKEIMTLVDRPLIQYAIDEARAAGITDFIFVTSRGKSALEDYFDHAPELEGALRRAGKTDLLEMVKATNMDSGAIAYVRQNRPLGLGHAVWCARRLIGNEPFAVILTDDVIAAETPCLKQMVDAYNELGGGNMVAAMEVAPARASSYGVLDVAEDMGSLVSVRGMVEKPKPGEAPSNLAVIGRYILTPKVLGNLNRMKQGAGGEIQLTDAIAEEIDKGEQVWGFRFRGQRFDCGSKAGFLQATVAFGLARDDLRDELRRFLHDVVALQKAAE